MTQDRLAEYAIEPLFLNRWSPRAFDPKAEMPQSDVLTILEAARWAPSAYNLQPWRFLYALREDAHWQDFLSILVPFNADWARNAGALVAVVSDTVIPGDGQRPDGVSSHNSFDAGAAWAHMALQATALGYHAHAMAGVDYDAAPKVLTLPERFKLEIMVALGKQGDASVLPDGLRQRDVPSGRRPLAESAFAGAFPA